MAYIDRDMAISRINSIRPVNPNKSDYTHGIDVGIAMAKVAINEQSTADVVERKTAYLVNPNPYGTCSECGFLMDIRDKFNFCPHCGSKMR